MRLPKRTRDQLRLFRNRTRNAVKSLLASGQDLNVSQSHQPIRFELRHQVNSRWNDDDRGYTITAKRDPFVRQDHQLFTMGSCFASEIKKALSAREISVLPNFSVFDYDSNEICIGDLGNNQSLVHYDTFVIRQEFEIACGELQFDPSEIYERYSATSSPFESQRFYVDPYRKSICGITPEAAREGRQIVDDAMRSGVETADVLVITLGLTECWKNRESGYFVWGTGVGRKSPLGEKLDFHRSTYEENLANLRRVCELVFSRWPDKRIVLTVSPVALGKTFTDQDIVVANMESKCTLRAVAGQICREFDNAIYWPSFEIAMKQDVFSSDGRHVQPDAVKFILDNFFRVHAQRAA